MEFVKRRPNDKSSARKTLSAPPRSVHPPRPPEPKSAERRVETRYSTKDTIELEVLPGPSQPVKGSIDEVSRSGLRVLLPSRIAKGKQVKIKLGRTIIVGEIRYCRAIPGGGFQAGILIEDLAPPSG
jgi:hypothetical protein